MSPTTPVALITGASRGIGRSLAHELRARDYQIVAVARNTDNLARLADELPGIRTYTADLAQKQQVYALAERLRAEEPRLDILVNNAGLFYPGELHTEPDSHLEELVAINLFSAYYLTKALIGYLQADANPRPAPPTVVNVCSTASLKAYANGGAYAVAKHALWGFSRCLREELKPQGIRVVSVFPGPVYTDSWAGVDLPEDRFCSPQDVGRAIADTLALSGRSVVEELLIRPQLGDL